MTGYDKISKNMRYVCFEKKNAYKTEFQGEKV